MIGAISLSGIVASINLLGSIDGLTFEAFVIRKLIPHLWQGAVVVWDNYSIHKGKEIEQAIARHGARLIYRASPLKAEGRRQRAEGLNSLLPSHLWV